MQSLNNDLQDLLIKNAKAQKFREVTLLASFMDELKHSANDAVVAQPTPGKLIADRFIKIGPTGLLLPKDAPKWDAVQDEETGLMWPAKSSDKEFTNKHGDSDAERYCRGLTLAGFSDWRLPTRKELLTLVDDTRHEPAIDTDYFAGVNPTWHWTSTPVANNPSGCAWYVNFGYGGSDWSGRGNGYHALAVRSARQ